MNHAPPIVTIFTASMYRAPGRYDLSPRNSRRRITSIINSAPYFGLYDCNAPGIGAFRGSSDCYAPRKPCVARSTPMGNPRSADRRRDPPCCEKIGKKRCCKSVTPRMRAACTSSVAQSAFFGSLHSSRTKSAHHFTCNSPRKSYGMTTVCTFPALIPSAMSAFALALI